MLGWCEYRHDCVSYRGIMRVLTRSTILGTLCVVKTNSYGKPPWSCGEHQVLMIWSDAGSNPSITCKLDGNTDLLMAEKNENISAAKKGIHTKILKKRIHDEKYFF
jgi:hypothetical protein